MNKVLAFGNLIVDVLDGIHKFTILSVFAATVKPFVVQPLPPEATGYSKILVLNFFNITHWFFGILSTTRLLKLIPFKLSVQNARTNCTEV